VGIVVVCKHVPLTRVTKGQAILNEIKRNVNIYSNDVEDTTIEFAEKRTIQHLYALKITRITKGHAILNEIKRNVNIYSYDVEDTKIEFAEKGRYRI